VTERSLPALRRLAGARPAAVAFAAVAVLSAPLLAFLGPQLVVLG